MLHWILIYSFTAKDLTNVGLFASILNNSNKLLSVVQMRSEYLSKYMIASFILARGQPNAKYQINKNALEQIALPIVIENMNKGISDAFSEFLTAIYCDYDLDKAVSLVEKMSKEAEDDILLKSYLPGIKK